MATASPSLHPDTLGSGRLPCSPRLATHMLAFEGDSKVNFFDGNFSEYEEWRRQTLGDAATRPHRITYRKLTR